MIINDNHNKQTLTNGGEIWLSLQNVSSLSENLSMIGNDERYFLCRSFNERCLLDILLSVDETDDSISILLKEWVGETLLLVFMSSFGTKLVKFLTSTSFLNIILYVKSIQYHPQYRNTQKHKNNHLNILGHIFFMVVSILFHFSRVYHVDHIIYRDGRFSNIRGYNDFA